MSFDMRGLLGLPLDQALDRMKSAGEEAVILFSRSPRRTMDAGTPRVVRVRPGQITVCFFSDGQPQKAE